MSLKEFNKNIKNGKEKIKITEQNIVEREESEGRCGGSGLKSFFTMIKGFFIKDKQEDKKENNIM